MSLPTASIHPNRPDGRLSWLPHRGAVGVVVIGRLSDAPGERPKFAAALLLSATPASLRRKDRGA